MPHRLEPLHVHGEDSQAIRVALLRVPAHQLLSYADAQHWLRQRAYHLVQPSCPQILHCSSCLTLSRKQHTVSTAQLLRVVRQQWLHAQTSQRTEHRVHISRIIFYYCYLHKPPKLGGWGSERPSNPKLTEYYCLILVREYLPLYMFRHGPREHDFL